MDPVDGNLSQSKYVISLDAIDLNFIPTTFSRYRGTEVTQIWTKGNLNLRENEYFDFEIKETGSEYNDGDDGNIHYDYTICHICNVEVPKPYLKDHFSSKKHKTYKKIIDISLDRLKNVINEEEVFVNTNINDSVYFCSSCVAIVKKDEKILHEKTLTHRNSLMVDKILNDFLDLYENDDSKYNNTAVDIKNNKINDTDDVKETSIVNNTKGHDEIHIVEDCNNLHRDIHEKIVNTAIIPESKKNVHIYIDFLKSATHLKDIKVLENNHLEIITLSGARVKMSADNFNGINKENIINRCILCRKSFAKDFKWEHLYEKQHVDQVSKPFVNENCIRNIDASWSHCAICNIGVQDYKLHITSAVNHKLILKKAVLRGIINISENINSNNTGIEYKTIFDKIETASLTDDSINNNVEIDTKPISVVPAAKKYLHAYIEFLLHTTKLKNIKIAHTNMLEITTLCGIKVKILEHNFNGLEYTRKSKMKCNLCQNNFHNHMKWDHLYEKNHVDLVSIPFKNRNCIRKIQTNLSHCALCNMCICNQALHITLDEKHKLCLNKALEINIDNVSAKVSQVHQATRLLNALTQNGDDQVASTSKTENNEILSNIPTIPINEQEFFNAKDTYFCKKCGLNVPDDYHIHARTHKIDEDLEKSEIHYLMSITDSENSLLCKVCKTMILNNDIKVKQHLQSLYHTINYKKMLEINNINEFVKYHFLCKSCEVCFVKTKEIIHINSKQHEQIQNVFTTKIQAKTKANPLPDMVLLKCENDIINGNSFRCILCNMNVPNHNYNIYTHLINALHVKAATNLTYDEVTSIHYHMDLTNFPKLSCMVCNVQLTMNQNNILTHVSGNTHKNTYKLTLKDNKVVKLNDGYICKLCDVSLAPMNELIHCYTKKHKQLLTEYQNKAKEAVESTSKILDETQIDGIKTYLLKDFKANPKELFCLVCNTKVPKTVNNITEHLKGLSHGSLYNSVLEENNIFKCCDDFECKLCQMLIVTGMEFSHISTKVHQDKIKDATKYECFICNVKLSKNDENIRLHNIGEQHTRMMELAIQNDIRIYNDKCFCERCEKVIENESVNEHLKNTLHIMSSYFMNN